MVFKLFWILFECYILLLNNTHVYLKRWYILASRTAMINILQPHHHTYTQKNDGNKLGF